MASTEEKRSLFVRDNCILHDLWDHEPTKLSVSFQVIDWQFSETWDLYWNAKFYSENIQYSRMEGKNMTKNKGDS